MEVKKQIGMLEALYQFEVVSYCLSECCKRYRVYANAKTGDIIKRVDITTKRPLTQREINLRRKRFTDFYHENWSRKD